MNEIIEILQRLDSALPNKEVSIRLYGVTGLLFRVRWIRQGGGGVQTVQVIFDRSSLLPFENRVDHIVKEVIFRTIDAYNVDKKDKQP
jgi:hypothetical protein